MTTLDQNREAIDRGILWSGIGIVACLIALLGLIAWALHFRYGTKPESTYMVSYTYGTHAGTGHGCDSFQLRGPIRSADDLRVICQQIAKTNGFTNAVILNIQKLPL